MIFKLLVNYTTVKTIIFVNSKSLVTSNILLEGILNYNSVHKKLNIVKIVDTTLSPESSPSTKYKLLIKEVIKKVFNYNHYQVPTNPSFYSDIYRISDNYNLDVYLPEEKINHPKTIEYIKSLGELDLALILGCPQIFKKPLIEYFDKIINYHNSYLPYYRGLNASNWALYYEEKYTGYTFHNVIEEIDRGEIYLQNKILNTKSNSALILNIKKCEHALQNLHSFFDKLQLNKPLKLQNQLGNYFGKRKFNKITTIETTELYSKNEIQNRLNSFEQLSIKYKNSWVTVTGLRFSNRGMMSSLMTSDGYSITITRIKYIPVKIFYLIQKLKF